MFDLKEFEATFLETLKERKESGTSLSKNTIKYKKGSEVIAEIYIQHLRNADGYYAGARAYSSEIENFCKEAAPPYKNNLSNPAFFLPHPKMSHIKGLAMIQPELSG